MLLDVMLPGFDGFAVCRRMRQLSSVPILMLTAPTDEINTVVGLELGADDHIAKPFRMRDLLARVAAVLRRPLLGTAPAAEAPPSLCSRDLFLDPATHAARRGDRSLTRKPRTFELLRFFMQHVGRAFSRDRLLA